MMPMLSTQNNLSSCTKRNRSRELFPYWKAPKFDLDGWDNIECMTELRFEKSDLALLLEALRIPEKFVCPQRTVCTGIEGLCILLKRLAYPCRYTDMVSRFGRNPTELCLIIYATHRLRSWDHPQSVSKLVTHSAKFWNLLDELRTTAKKFTVSQISHPISVDHSFRHYRHFVSGQHCAGGRGECLT